MAKYLNISKIDAAKRQLEIAISLFFNESDIVSIHTLAAAAHEIFSVLAKKQAIKSIIKDHALDIIKKGKQREFYKIVKKAENFFKHADRDSNKLLKFYYEQTEIIIYDCCLMYFSLTKEGPPMMRLFLVWIYTKYPEFLKESAEKANAIEAARQLSLTPGNRSKYLKLLKLMDAGKH